MRKMSVVCDVCGGTVEKFNGAVTLASFGTIYKDACSPKCLAATLRGLAAEIEKREGMKAADNIAFAAQHPEATKIPEAEPVPAGAVRVARGDGTMGWEVPKPAAPAVTVTEQVGPVVPGCAACDAGVPVNTENDFRHTGEGKLCKAVKGQGPCACAPSNWKMVPNDSSTPGPREVTCHACGNVWESMIRDPEKEAAAAAPAPATKKRGRKKPEPTATATNGTATNGSLLDQAETPENKAARDRQMGRTFAPGVDELERLKNERAPRWCSCGKQLVFTQPTKEEPLGQWSCEEGHALVPMGVKEGQPGENLSQLLTDVAKLGVNLNLVDVAAWPVIKRDMLRAWVAQPEAGPPDFLRPTDPPPETLPEPAPAPEQPKYTF